jgi:2-amino-4-hydroxy-6-hydroxymethyldihydropteridine diphosphokinase
MNVAYLCLGGNIGNRKLILTNAIVKIKETIGSVISASHIYETEAWGVINQQAYLNMCIEVCTPLKSDKLIKALLEIELMLGRERNTHEQYSARTIDIDILFYNNERITSEELIVPHPRLHLRKFVLIPLHDIAPHYKHPIFKKSTAQLLIDCNDISNVKLYKH